MTITTVAAVAAALIVLQLPTQNTSDGRHCDVDVDLDVGGYR